MKVAILIFTFFLFSCNSNDPKTDADKAVPDKDSVAVIDSDTQDADTGSVIIPSVKTEKRVFLILAVE